MLPNRVPDCSTGSPGNREGCRTTEEVDPTGRSESLPENEKRNTRRFLQVEKVCGLETTHNVWDRDLVLLTRFARLKTKTFSINQILSFSLRVSTTVSLESP